MKKHNNRNLAYTSWQWQHLTCYLHEQRFTDDGHRENVLRARRNLSLKQRLHTAAASELHLASIRLRALFVAPCCHLPCRTSTAEHVFKATDWTLNDFEPLKSRRARGNQRIRAMCSSSCLSPAPDKGDSYPWCRTAAASGRCRRFWDMLLPRDRCSIEKLSFKGLRQGNAAQGMQNLSTGSQAGPGKKPLLCCEPAEERNS